MGRSNAGAGQHRHRRFRNHRHVDTNAIALDHPHALKHVGHLAHLPMQLGIGQRAGVPRFSFPYQGRLITPVGRQVPIETVIGNIDLTTPKPLGKGRLPVQHSVPFLKPVQLLLRQLGPERRRVSRRLIVEGLILVSSSNHRCLSKFSRRFKQSLLVQNRFDSGL